MIKLLKKRRKEGSHTRQAMAEIIMDKATKLQYCIAGYLNNKTKNWRPDRLKLSLVLFCLFAGAMWVAVLGVAIWCPKHEALLVAHPGKLPAFIGHTNDKAVYSDQFISKTEFGRLERFKTYMDSLGTTETGKQVKDSILSGRPKLMDSLATVEQLYNKQN